jgi:predicted RNase H-like HicB family nuclease
MTNLMHSLVIEPTDDPSFFGFYSPDLEGFTGTGLSIEDCLAKAPIAMKEQVEVLKQTGRPVPAINPSPKAIVRNPKRVIPAA